MHYVSTSVYVSHQPRMHSVETPATDRITIPLILRKLVYKNVRALCWCVSGGVASVRGSCRGEAGLWRVMTQGEINQRVPG